MKSPFKNKQFKNLLYYFLLAIAVIIAYKFIMEIDTFFGAVNWLLRVISPFMSGFLLAYILNIPCGGIQRFLTRSKLKFICRRKKGISIIVVYLLSFLVVSLIVMVVAPYIGRSVELFTANFNYYYESAQNFIDYVDSLNILTLDISMDKILDAIREFSLQKLPASLDALFSVSVGIFNIFITLISSVYILAEKDKFKKYINRLAAAALPESVWSAVLKYTRILNVNFKRYIYTQTVDGCILGTIATIELFLLKSPYALVLGIMLGIVNYIPYFGSIFGSLFAVLIVAFTQGIPTAALAALIILITQQIDANVIQPRLMSGSFSLSPLLVIISITIGGALSGILGMIVAIPVVAVMKDIIEELIAYREKGGLEGSDAE